MPDANPRFAKCNLNSGFRNSDLIVRNHDLPYLTGTSVISHGDSPGWHFNSYRSGDEKNTITPGYWSPAGSRCRV